MWLSRQRWISDLYKRFVIVEGDVDDRTADINYENQRRADPRAAREWLNDCLRRDDVDVVAARAERTLIIVARHDRLVDVERLKGLIAKLPDLHVFTDTDQGHGWNEAAVHRQLEVLKDFFGNCQGTARTATMPRPSAASDQRRQWQRGPRRPALRDTVTAPALACLSFERRARPNDSRIRALELEQASLAIEPPPVSGEPAVRADQTMAGDHDRDRVLSVGGAHRSRTARGRPICAASCP